MPVEYKGEQQSFKAVLNVYGFTHKFHVDVNGQTIIFEPDEERNYRAVLNYDEVDKNKNIDIDLLKNLAKSLKEIIKWFWLKIIKWNNY